MNNIDIIDKLPKLQGHTTIFSFASNGNVRSLFFRKNQIMDGAALATAKVWGGYSNYKAGAMYFEFQNLSAPGDTPSYPTFVPSAGVEYYTGLQYSPDKDFLRVPVLVSPAVTATATGYLLTLYAIAPDVNVGYWDKPFTGASYSVVIGGALVATVDAAPANDVVLCRNYPTNTKIAKVNGEQIGMTWNVEFPFPIVES